MLEDKKSDGDGGGFIERLYAPDDDDDIQEGERAFFTRRNAKIIDNLRLGIDDADEHLRDLLLGPLLAQVSLRSNTAGHFRGFYKGPAGVGQFGGRTKDKLYRICGDVVMSPPILSKHECDWCVTCQDAVELVGRLDDIDVAYFDPPYNQHPYGSMYFMLDLVTSYEEPTTVSKVSGIPPDWNRSEFNVRAKILRAFERLVADVPAKFALVSYSNEGFVTHDELLGLLKQHGSVEVISKSHAAYKGGKRHLVSKSAMVDERLYVLEKR